MYDDLDDEGEVDEVPTSVGSPAPSAHSADAAVPAAPEAIVESLLPENMFLPLPSSYPYDDQDLSDIELRLRTAKVEKHLQNLRELIAEKSFMYSHVMRVAPRKAVRTRARANIAKLNISITHLCRAYTKSRLALLNLGAAAEKYPMLLRTDVRASTAILDPNQPGSTTTQLSWLWQVHRADTEHSGSLTECKHR